MSIFHRPPKILVDSLCQLMYLQNMSNAQHIAGFVLTHISLENALRAVAMLRLLSSCI